MEQKQNTFTLEDISFSFGKGQCYFFVNVNAQFPAYKMSFISGQNGAGKSTLLRILSGALDSWERVNGSLRFPSDPSYAHPLGLYKLHKYSFMRKILCRRNNEALKERVKVVQQNIDTMIADQFTFIENLRLANLPQYPYGKTLPEHKPLPDFIKRFGIDYTKPARLLSGGQRQILAILMALQKRAEILLLDEPTAALDSKNATMVMEFLTEFLALGGVTIIVVCHDYSVIRRYAQGYYYFLDAPYRSEEDGDVILDGAALRTVPVDQPLYSQ